MFSATFVMLCYVPMFHFVPLFLLIAIVGSLIESLPPLRHYRSSLIVNCNFDYISLYALSMKGVNVKVEYICVYAYDITMYQYTRI